MGKMTAQELVLSSDYFYKGTCVKSMEISTYMYCFGSNYQCQTMIFPTFYLAQAVENAVCQYTSSQPQVGSSR